MSGDPPPLLKDFVDADLIERIAGRIAAVHPGFDRSAFRLAAAEGLEALELKPRIAQIAAALAEGLPACFAAAAGIVVRAADHSDPPIGAWEAWPLNTFIEASGTDDVEAALDAMERITRHASSEFALRPFLERHPGVVWRRLEAWVEHPEEAVRRLASEGTRPLLPWGMRVAALREDPRPGLGVIARLIRDPSEIVRRSVANHLNDVSKDHPGLAVAAAREWMADPTRELERLVSHALRTLVKRGDPEALRVLGFATEAAVDVLEFSCTPERVRIGGHTDIVGRLRSTAKEPRRLVADLVVHYVKANGTTSPKVFKGRVLDLEPGEEAVLRRKLSVADMSTRTHHPGTHRVVLRVAGEDVTEAEVLLTRD